VHPYEEIRAAARRMLTAQRELQDYLASEVTDRATFRRLYIKLRAATDAYSEKIRKFMDDKYSD
jgi:hypothetical protein